MPDYRLYLQDAAGRFMRAELATVPSDEAALARARGLDHAHCIEVWSGARMVGMVKPEGN